MDRYLGFITAQGGRDILRTHVPGVETTFAISGAVFTNFNLLFLNVIAIGILNRITTAVFFIIFFYIISSRNKYSLIQ